VTDIERLLVKEENVSVCVTVTHIWVYECCSAFVVLVLVPSRSCKVIGSLDVRKASDTTDILSRVT